MFKTTKLALHQHCITLVQEALSQTQQALSAAIEASQDDTKSSAGDKYETGREMAQQDINRNKQQLFDNQQKLNLLQNLENTEPSTFIKDGNLVLTNKGNFYLSIGLGQVKIEEDSFYVISSQSPIGKMLLGKKEGEQFRFNQTEYHINNIL